MALENMQRAWIEEEAETSTPFLQKFKLYETRSNFYMIGRDKSRNVWKVLKIDRSEPSELNILEDSTTYSEVECSDLLRRIHEGNKSTGGLKFVATCYGIIGFIKFLGPYYMLLITKRRKIGTICGHAVYAISKSEMIPIPNSTVRSNMDYSKNEKRSFVNSACKCKTSVVLIRRPKQLELELESRNTFIPLYLLENCLLIWLFYLFSIELFWIISSEFGYLFILNKFYSVEVIFILFLLYTLVLG